MALNEIAYGLIPFLHEGDEILLSIEEHASNILPWFKVAEITKAFIRYLPLEEDGRISIETYKKYLSNHTPFPHLNTRTGWRPVRAVFLESSEWSSHKTIGL